MDFLLFVLTVLGRDPDFRGHSHTCTFGSAWAEDKSMTLYKGWPGQQRPLSLGREIWLSLDGVCKRQDRKGAV